MMTKRSFIMILTAVLAMAAMSTAAWAARPLKGCSLNGTWSGWADSSTSPSMLWLALQTTDSNDTTKGELLMNWVGVSQTLLTVGGGYAATTHLTPGHGVWQQTSGTGFNYTWYAYGMDVNDIPLYSVMVVGTATFSDTNCDTPTISYWYEVFDGMVTPQDMSAADPSTAVYGTSGQGGETRVPLVAPPQ